MKKYKKVIAYKYLPAKLPIQPTAIWFLLMKHFNATPLWWGITGTIVGLIWIACILSICMEKQTSIRDMIYED